MLKARGVRQSWTSVLGDDGREITQQSEMMKEISTKWASLWTDEMDTNGTGWEEEAMSEYLEDWSVQQDQGLGEFMLRPINLEEVMDILKEIQTGSSPGADGLPWEFWKEFRGEFGGWIVEMTNAVLHLGKWLADSKLGLVSLIYKNKGDWRVWRNWQPIMLLNVDHKLVSKILAKWLQERVGALVGKEQCGFIKDRQIRDSTAWVQNVLEGCWSRGIDGRLVFLDQEKAFDRVSWNYMVSVLQKIGFSHPEMERLMGLLRGGRAAIIMNGWCSEEFPLGRGVPQGDPLSPLLYVLSLEPLIDNMRRKMTGLQLGGVNWKLGAFADDMVVGMGSPEDIDTVRTEIQ